MERRLINVNDLGRYTVEISGHRYVPWAMLAEVPTADAAVHSRYVNIAGYQCCENCGASAIETEAKPDNPSGFAPYCFNCGAKMDGGDKDAEK